MFWFDPAAIFNPTCLVLILLSHLPWYIPSSIQCFDRGSTLKDEIEAICILVGQEAVKELEQLHTIAAPWVTKLSNGCRFSFYSHTSQYHLNPSLLKQFCQRALHNPYVFLWPCCHFRSNLSPVYSCLTPPSSNLVLWSRKCFKGWHWTGTASLLRKKL